MLYSRSPLSIHSKSYCLHPPKSNSPSIPFQHYFIVFSAQVFVPLVKFIPKYFILADDIINGIVHCSLNFPFFFSFSSHGMRKFPSQGSNSCHKQWQSDPSPLGYQGTPLISFLDGSLFVYRITIAFCMLIFVSCSFGEFVNMLRFSDNIQISVKYHANRKRAKNHIIISIDTEKALDKIQHPIMIFKKFSTT